MPNLAPVDTAEAGDATDIIETVKARLGQVPNIFATMAQSPAALEGYLAFNGALEDGALSPALREQIALAIAGENSCNYCASAHTFIARKVGVDPSEAALNLLGKASDTSTAVVLGFVTDLVRNRGQLPDAASALNDLRKAGYTERELVEILAHVGLNLFTNYFNHVAGTEVDFPFVNTVAA